MEFFDEDRSQQKARDTVAAIMSSVCKYAVFGAGLVALGCLLMRR